VTRRSGLALALGLAIAATTVIAGPVTGGIIAALGLAPLGVAVMRRYPWASIGIYLVLIPWVVRASEIELGTGIPNLDFERLGIYGISSLVLFQVATRKRRLLRLTHFDRIFLLFIAMMLISGVIMGQSPPQTVRQVVSENCYPFALYFSMKHLVRRPGEVRALALFAVAAAVLLAAHACGDQVLGLGLGKVERESITTYQQLAELGGYHSLQENRAAGPLGNSVTLGVSLIQGIVLAFFFIVNERGRTLRLCMVAALGLCGIALLVTYTRSVYIALVLCGLLIWSWMPRLRRALAVATILSGIAALGYLSTVITDDDNRLLKLGSIEERIGAYSITYYFVKASPIIGHGYGYQTYPHLKSQNLVPRLDFVSRHNQFVNNAPHSEIGRILITMGVVGLAIFGRYLWTMFGELADFRRHLEELELQAMLPWIVAAACGMIAFYGQGPFTDMTAMHYADTVVFLFLGAVLGVYENARLRRRAGPREGSSAAIVDHSNR